MGRKRWIEMLGSKEIGKPLFMKNYYRKGASVNEVVTAKG